MSARKQQKLGTSEYLTWKRRRFFFERSKIASRMLRIPSSTTTHHNNQLTWGTISKLPIYHSHYRFLGCLKKKNQTMALMTILCSTPHHPPPHHHHHPHPHPPPHLNSSPHLRNHQFNRPRPRPVCTKEGRGYGSLRSWSTWFTCF